jgi:hypothetical protein
MRDRHYTRKESRRNEENSGPWRKCMDIDMDVQHRWGRSEQAALPGVGNDDVMPGPACNAASSHHASQSRDELRCDALRRGAMPGYGIYRGLTSPFTGLPCAELRWAAMFRVHTLPACLLACLPTEYYVPSDQRQTYRQDGRGRGRPRSRTPSSPDSWPPPSAWVPPICG